MTPTSPVIPGANLNETVIAKDQPEYIPLPAVFIEGGLVLTRWKLSVWERIKIFFIGYLYHYQLTFNKPLQPIKLELTKPDIVINPK